MHDSLRSLNEQLELNTRLFLNSLDGADDDAALARPGQESNHMAYIACHLVDARCFLARLVGVDIENPFKALLDPVQSVNDLEKYPPLEGIRSAWHEVSTALSQRFPALSAAELRRESPQKFPVNDKSVLGGVAFLLAHEAFHIGQLAFLRKYVGLGPMSY